MHGDLETVRLLVEAGADIEGKGDDPGVGIVGWATCFRQVREDVADVPAQPRGNAQPVEAIALDQVNDVRAMVTRDPALLAARMTRNHHRRTPLHHAAARNRLAIVQLLLELGADPNGPMRPARRR